MKDTLRSIGVSPQRSIRRAVAPGSENRVASRTKVRTVARTTVAPALGPRVRSTLTRPLESVTARAAPNRPLVTFRFTTSPAVGPPAVSRTWNTRGSAGRVPTEPCCPTPETNPVSVVDRSGRGRGSGGGGARGGAAATGGGATSGATIRRAASAGGRRTRGGRARAAPGPGAGRARAVRRAQASSARNRAVSPPSDMRSARSRSVGVKLRQLRWTRAASSADPIVPTVSKRTRSVLRSGSAPTLCPGARTTPARSSREMQVKWRARAVGIPTSRNGAPLSPRLRTGSGPAPCASDPGRQTRGGPCCSSASELRPRGDRARAHRRPTAVARTAPRGR